MFILTTAHCNWPTCACMHIYIRIFKLTHMQVNTLLLLPTLWRWWYIPKRRSQMGHKPFTSQMVDLVYLHLPFVIPSAVHHQIASRLGQANYHCSCALQLTVPSDCIAWLCDICNVTSCKVHVVLKMVLAMQSTKKGKTGFKYRHSFCCIL